MKYLFYFLVLPFTLGIQPLDKAMEAGYIQSGAEHTVTSVQNYLVDTYARPYYLDKLAAPYVIYRRKQIDFRVWHEDRLTLAPYKASFSFPVPFL